MEKQKIAILFLLGFSTFVAFESWRLGVGKFNDPGPGFLSFAAALAVFLLSSYQAFKGWGRDLAKKQPPPLRANRAKVFCILCGIFAFPLLLSHAGFLLCTFIFIGFCLKIIAAQKWKTVLAMSFGATIVSHLIFSLWLSIKLPQGTWVNQFLDLTSSLWK